MLFNIINVSIFKYIIETKIWDGEIAHKKGLNQLKNYLEIEGLNKGYLLIFNFNQNKEYTHSKYYVDDKTIVEVRA